jgi:bacillithiol system protein YtxJ
MGWFSRSRQDDSAQAEPAGASKPVERFTFVAVPDDLEAVFSAPLALLYKHSTRCGTSTFALAQVRRFAEAEPDVPIFLVDVHSGRAASDEMARRTGIHHESPQAFILRAGEVRWNGSHSEVRDSTLQQALASA